MVFDCLISTPSFEIFYKEVLSYSQTIFPEKISLLLLQPLIQYPEYHPVLALLDDYLLVLM